MPPQLPSPEAPRGERSPCGKNANGYIRKFLLCRNFNSTRRTLGALPICLWLLGRDSHNRFDQSISSGWKIMAEGQILCHYSLYLYQCIIQLSVSTTKKSAYILATGAQARQQRSKMSAEDRQARMVVGVAALFIVGHLLRIVVVLQEIKIPHPKAKSYGSFKFRGALLVQFSP